MAHPAARALGAVGIYRWYVLAILWAVYILAFFDRYLLGLLIEPIKRSLGLTDFQIGLLLGPAFSLFHITLAIPMGWLADRSNRVLLLAAGVLVWCSMTAGSAFAVAFLPLFLLRLGLGLGETVVGPTSFGIIGDYFDRKTRPFAITIYSSAIYLGAGLAFLVGGNIVGWLERRGSLQMFGLGPFEPWQAAFLIIGAPGLVFALLLLTVREPQRQERRANVGGAADMTGITLYVLRRWRGFGVLFAASGCNTALSALAFWNIPLFSRVWGWDVATTGTAAGLLYFTAGPLGTVLSLFLSKWLVEKFPSDGTMRMLLLGLMIGVPASAVYPMTPTPELAVAVMGIAFVGKGIAMVAGPAALSLILPGDLRSRGVALFNAVIGILGSLLAPPLIGLAVDLTGDPRAINVVLCAFVLIFGGPTIVLVARSMGHYRTTLRAIEADLARAGG